MATVNLGGGIRAFSIFNSTDGTTYEIDGADISPESTISAEKILRDSSKGGTSSIATTWTIEILFADDSIYSSLDSADSQTREWQATAAGLNGRNLQWYEDSTFVVDETILTDPTSTDFPYRLRMTHTSVSPSIYADVNLLSYGGAGITNSFDLSNEESTIQFAVFKPDGTKMYAGGVTNDTIYEYDLSTAWDVSTSSYSGNSFDASTQESTLRFAVFKPDGTKMFAGGSGTDTVYEYDLSTAWDVSTASYSSTSFDVSTQESELTSVAFKPDGTKMFAVGLISSTVFEYDLSTAWDVSTASYSSNSFDVSSQATSPYFVVFKPDGTKMYTGGIDTDTVFEYDLSTAWDVSTASYSSNSFDVSSQELTMTYTAFKPDGTKMYSSGADTDSVYEYDLATAWDVSTVYYQDYQLIFPINSITLTYSAEYGAGTSDTSTIAVADFDDITLQASQTSVSGSGIKSDTLAVDSATVYFVEASTGEDSATTATNVAITTNGQLTTTDGIDY